MFVTTDHCTSSCRFNEAEAMSRASSPDSSLSISSLLASCSLSRSGSSSRSSAIVTYNDRLYDSASKALEAYIRDYEEGLQSPLQTGKISLGGSARARPPAAKRANPRLKTKQTSSRRRPPARDVELLSLTTDDLLSYPSDGSLPISSSSLSEQGHRRKVRRLRVSPTRRQVPLASSLNRAPRLNLRDLHPREFPESLHKHGWKSRSSRRGEDSENEPVLNNCTASSYLPQTSGLSKSYPRWMTSQKSELSVSGLTSVPDVRYPVWLKTHGLLSDSDSDAISASYRSLETHSRPKMCRNLQGALSMGGSPSLQVPLKDTYQDREGSRNVTLTHPVNRNLTSHPSSINNHTSVLWKRLVQDKIEVAEAFPKDDPSRLRHHGSPWTEDILEVERSWEHIPFPLKPPVPVLCEDDAPGPQSVQKPKLIEDFLNDCLKSDSKVPVSTFSGGNHHGPVEALKHMLFNLQTFQQSIGQGTTTEHAKEVTAISNPESLHLEQEAFPVNKSLQKAMHHLSRLKELVGDGSVRRKENHEET